MHRFRALLPLVVAAAMLIVPGTALAAWQVVTPAGTGSSWYQYPSGTPSGTTTGTGTTTTGGTTGASNPGTTGGTTTGTTGGSTTGGSTTGGSTTGGTTTTTTIGDGWYQYRPPSPSTGTTSGSTTGSATGTTGTTGSTGSTGSTTGSAAGSTSSAGLSAAEQQLFSTVNQLRLSHGLNALTINPTLVTLAREKSQDMITNNYFSHTSPTLGTPYQMQVNAGLRCSTMGGENIAGAADISRAIFMFETSPPHMQNILYPAYTETGIGVVADGPYGVYVTQEFVGGC